MADINDESSKSAMLWRQAFSENKSERAAAQAELSSVANRLSKLIDSLGDENANVRAVAAEWLGRIGDKEAVQPLLHTFKTELSEPVKDAILQALDAIKAFKSDSVWSDKRHFEFEEGDSSKFWDIKLGECNLSTWWGRLGTSGQSKTIQFDSDEQALAQYKKLVAEKTKKGYKERQPEKDLRMLIDSTIRSYRQKTVSAELGLKETVSVMQEHGLLNELDQAELIRLRQQLVGRIDESQDSSISHFDFIYEYYCNSHDFVEVPTNRMLKDSCFCWLGQNEHHDFVSALNRILGKSLVVDNGDFEGVHRAYNLKLATTGDDKRLFQMAGSYGDREVLMALDMDTACKLILAGAGYLFEDPIRDLTPESEGVPAG